MRILVAGSKSFLGQNFKRYYSNIPDYTVKYLSREDCDLSVAQDLLDIVKIYKPDLLIHSAVSLTSLENNLSMYLALERVSTYCGKVVMIGSGAEYSHQRYRPAMPESYFDPLSPPENSHPYHTSKHLISRIHQSCPQNIYNFRVFGLYGPFEDYRRRLISSNILGYLQHGKMTVSANHAFDYLYVDDLISAVNIFANSSHIPKYSTYNVCTGRADRFLEILTQVIVALGGTPIDINIDDPSPTDYIYSGDPSLFESEFNYKIENTSYLTATLAIKDWLSASILKA